MHQDLDFIRNLALEENTVIRRSQFAKLKTANNIVSEAQRRAKALIKEACQDAEGFRKEALLAGYERGLLMAVKAIGQFMISTCQQEQRLCSKLQQETTDLLRRVLVSEQVIMDMLERWIDETTVDFQEGPLNILMPLSAKMLQSRFYEIIDKRQFADVNLEFHDSSFFIFKYKDKLAEFDPEVFIEAEVSRMISRLDLHKCFQKISEKAVQELHHIINLFYPLSSQSTNRD